MKHSAKITAILLTIFILSQFIGLFIVDSYSIEKTKTIDGKEVKEIEYNDLPYDIERPDLEEGTSYIPMLIMVLLVTFFILLIIKFNVQWLWKAWFFLSVVFCLLISFAAFLSSQLAIILSIVLSYAKIFKNNVVTQNISELFIYGGLAAVFVPIMNLASITIFLIIISIYDYIAVNKTKHMVKMAKSHTKLNIFPGIMIPYSKNKFAILGGGDIGLPLIFAGVVMKTYGNLAYLIPFFTAGALFYLMYIGKKNKFYPAMPFITAGCLLAYLIILII
ncbi:MAG: presenilin family intramembrane aspartyl protease [Nanoarchaeota archaeon]|nr:presenilin family intramembrane aspartyl protease [Nanoarchaeota archaeon]